MEPSHTPWPYDEPPTEAGLEDLLRAEGLSPGWWENVPGERYSMHEHTYHKVLYCLRGSIAFFLPDSCGRVDLAPGDRLDPPPHTPHSALVGREGVRCVEAPRWDQ
jgi:hypothetical protein